MKLYPYQRQGVNKMLNQSSIFLCDDMGLGKTIQALACMAELHKQNSEFKFLVVAPTSVVFNWQSETQRFLPKLRVNRYIGKDRTDLKAVIKKSDLLNITFISKNLNFLDYLKVIYS